MLDMDVGSGECGGYAVVALRGELDLMDAADVADALEAFAAREPRVIVDLSRRFLRRTRTGRGRAVPDTHERDLLTDVLGW
jgi:hypothetical protein